MRKSLAILLAIAACVAGIMGCGGSGSSDGGGEGGTLRMGITGTTVESLNPFVGQSSLSLMTYRLLYPHVVEYDKQNKIADAFATSKDLAGDNLTWTFKTQPNAKWSDGQPLTAADAAWTINTIVKYQKGPAAQLGSYVEGIASASAPNPDTLEVKLAKPTGTLLNSLANIPILPQHVWEQYARGTGAQLKTFPNSDPVGGGSFLVSSFIRNQSILMERNPDYYGTPAKLAAAGFVFYQNTDGMVNAIESGEIDVALDVAPTTIKTLEGNSAVKVLSTPGFDTILLGINSNPDKATNPELRNLKLREALALGIDRQKISDTVTLGTGGTTESFLPTNNPYYDKSIGEVEYDPEKANQILDELGYTKNSSGIREVEGRPMSYKMIFGNTTTGAPLVVNLIVNEMKKLGIEAKAVEMDPAAYTAAINADDYTKFDFSVDDYGPDFEPTHYLALPTCGQFGAENETGYCTKEYDKLYAEQATERPEEREATIDKMQQVLLRDRPLIPIYSAPTVMAVRDNVSGVEPSPITILDYESAQWLNEATVK
jgi:peptide/nickel transport system substrate-binding protein